MARQPDVCYLEQRNMKIKGIKPFASGRIRITNRKTGKTFHGPKVQKAFIDSGASGSVISESTLRKLYSKIGPFRTKPGKVITGNGIKKIRLLEDVEICIDHCCYGGEVEPRRGEARRDDSPIGELPPWSPHPSSIPSHRRDRYEAT